MFYHTKKMTQMTMKILLRNVGFLFFGIALPIFATLILNIKNVGDVIVEESTITELSGADDQVAYLNDYEMFSVKVYDSSDSEVTTSFLKNLADEGIFQIYRVDVSELSDAKIMESAENTALKDKTGAVVIIGKDFPQAILNGELSDSITLYETGEDERYELLLSSAELLANEYIFLGEYVSSVKELEQKIIEYENKGYPIEMNEYTVKTDHQISTFDVDYKRTGSLGYTMAILSLAFLFSGIMILGTITQEKQNLVYTRIMLTKAGNGSYMMSKFLVILFASIIQTGITGLAYTLLVKTESGLTLWQLLFLVFLMGLIFNTLSVCVGICIGSVLSAAYLSFFIWMITALLGGLYFDISGASESMQKISMLMPQRWALKGAQMMMDGNNYAYPLILTVTTAYLIVILVIGMLGLSVNRKE